MKAAIHSGQYPKNKLLYCCFSKLLTVDVQMYLYYFRWVCGNLTFVSPLVSLVCEFDLEPPVVWVLELDSVTTVPTVCVQPHGQQLQVILPMLSPHPWHLSVTRENSMFIFIKINYPASNLYKFVPNNMRLKNKRPTWCHLLFYFTTYVLNMFRTLIYPSSGAWDSVVELPHRWFCSVKTTDVVIQQHSHKLLIMDILMSETCWVHKKWNKIASDIKLIFYSSTIKMMYGPINTKYEVIKLRSLFIGTGWFSFWKPGY